MCVYMCMWGKHVHACACVCVCLIDMYTCACDCRYTVCAGARGWHLLLYLSPFTSPLIFWASCLIWSSPVQQDCRTCKLQESFYLISVSMLELGSELPTSHLHGRCCTSRLISHPLLLRYDFRKSKDKEAKPDKAKKFSHRVRFRAGGRISCGKINSLHCSSDLYLFLLTRISFKKFPLPPLTFMILLMLEPPPPIHTHWSF